MKTVNFKRGSVIYSSDNFENQRRVEGILWQAMYKDAYAGCDIFL